MKSAIFQDPGLAGHNRQTRKQPPKKWPRASSPIVMPVSTTALPTWNFDDMLSNYTASGNLPPILSPTLPPRFAAKETYPVNSAQGAGSDDDVDTDSLPLSLLSPTLPSLFRNTSSSQDSKALAHPLPEKPSSGNSMISNEPKSPKTSKVRWINRLDDPKKPRFLLRISFGPQAIAYKRIKRSKPLREERQDTLPDEVHGLAISGLKRTQERAAKTLWPGTYKEFLARHTKLVKENPLLAIAAQFDWILCSAIACDAERSNKLKSTSSNVDAWSNLYSDIPSFVHRIERFIKTNSVSDRKKSCLSFLVGILAVCKATILKRANALLLSSAEEISHEDSSTEKKQKTIDIQQQQIQNYRKMEECFAESQSFFKNSPLPSTVCPKTWSSRSSTITKPTEIRISPSTDLFFLPLGPYSDLGEAYAFLYGCLREFIDVFNIEVKSGTKYLLQSGKDE
ncbi:hypothetical protein METBIDRAFT_41146 [Metschnikowia bicuspidata var. bicuspidata NRRL YB-4993]|uniref:Uncharacterized protein n=1 Tax=Metschnikowia bicuspidata var. bicuspidata NRRL YB-4993 TaxID=869754 RepID=A0A1A0HCJ1_9ASCO|nr:hypothetical protein METBIDRAFT_41146 [Metschnikowia bicuspidata var. bicuspidata NRRL YB-4993]OBA21607.1 hypothetical protein METBIDRAFT_41146 [Metschnikowia bicuspidata var. bicuspidata NRRL YB-4993]